uniref:Uncharacterized protein n=1 Tax=Paulinella chromatophora TaxID=39717 RepID=B1X4D5_PAUCH|nr:hypothetical protein PCC_0363 [Paulinella chromatophora]ACB42804.1 hypothetical protein PCC_0363 [Paulinella chromatophora]
MQAIANRLVSRFHSNIASSIAHLVVFSQEMPERIDKEWKLFREEVTLEDVLLDKEIVFPESSLRHDDANIFKNRDNKSSTIRTTQCKVNYLRARVVTLSNQLMDFS